MRRKTRVVLIILIILIGLLTIMSSLLSNAVELPLEVKRLAWPLLLLVMVALIGLTALQFWLQAGARHSAADARENRQIMLGRVQNKWITGFLENPLYHSYDEQLLPLPLRRRVGSRFDLVLSNPLEPTQTLPSGTTLVQVFDQTGGELLMLGEPGAGKTTLLFELARDLLKRAKDNPMAPMPIVLMLSSWATKKLPLEQWIAEELKAKYDIPSQIGKAWVKANQLLLLLDGLDEVAPSVLPACIDAINAYHHQARRSLVVCSRTKEFLDQPGRLALHTAVIVQPLSFEQVDAYLDGLAAKGEDVEGLKQTLHQSETLRALATTPLFLTVLILAYHGKPAQELLALVKAAPTDQQHHIFHDYVERILWREGTRIYAPARQTKHWLGWLACQMTAHHQSELYLEQFQPDWLPKKQRAFYQWSIIEVFGLGVGLLAGLTFGLLVGLGVGLLVGLLGWLGDRLLGGLGDELEEKIEPVEVLTWSQEVLRSRLRVELGVELGGGLFATLLVGLLVGLFYALVYARGVGLFATLAFGLLLGLGIVLGGGLSRKQLTERSMLSPNEGIRRSLKNGLFFGLLGGLGFGLGDALFGWPTFGLLVGLGAGLAYGLLGWLLGGLFFGLGAAMQHYTLRFWLWQARCTPAPWRYVAFLDDAVEQLLLRKVGGGYIFRHHLLQDYFVSLDVVPPHDPSFRAEARSV